MLTILGIRSFCLLDNLANPFTLELIRGFGKWVAYIELLGASINDNPKRRKNEKIFLDTSILDDNNTIGISLFVIRSKKRKDNPVRQKFRLDF